MVELKPCPFCGREAIKNENVKYSPNETSYGCSNDECVCSEMSWATYNQWNTRPVENALRARIAELEQAQSDHWTFISEKPPEKDGNYLCTLIDTKGCKWVDIRTYSVSYGWFTFGERVVCWMPKPTVPTDLSGSSASESRCDNS